MDLYPGLIRARAAAADRIRDEASVLMASGYPPLERYGRSLRRSAATTATSTSAARDLTLHSGAFWTALIHRNGGQERLLRLAADVFLHSMSPAWSRALLFVLGCVDDRSDVSHRFEEAKESESEAGTDIESGIALHDAGRFDEAINVYEQVLRRHPNAAWARYEKCLSLSTLYPQQHTEQARALCAEVLDQDPFFARAYVDPAPSAVFRNFIAPFANGRPKDRAGRMRFALGLQKLGQFGLAALAWYGLMQEDSSQLELREPVASCLRALGLEDVLAGSAPPDGDEIGFVSSAGGDREKARATLRTLQHRGRTTMDVGRHDAALAIALEALSIAQLHLGDSDPEVALAHNLVGAVKTRLERLPEAEMHLRHAADILRSAVVPDDPTLVTILHNLGVILFEQGKFPEARDLLIQGRSLARDEEMLAVLLHTAARVELKLGQVVEAIHLSKQAAEISARVHTPNDSLALQLLSLASEIASAQGKPEEALGHMELKLARESALLGREHPKTAATINNLAGLHEDLGRPARAEELLLESLALRERLLGKDHPDAATAHNNLGLLQARQGRLEEAKRSLSNALAIRRERLAPGHPLLPVTLQNLAEIEEALGQHVAAFEHLREAFTQDSELLGRMATGRNASERSLLMAQVGRRFGGLVRIVLEHLTDHPEAMRAAAACIVARKGFLDTASTAWVAGQDTKVLRAFLGRYASLVLGGPRALSSREYRMDLGRTEETIGYAEQRHPAAETPAPTADALLEELQRTLGDRVLLEFVLLDGTRGPAHPDSVAHYAALILSARARHMIDLGPAGKIDKLVARFRQIIEEASAWVVGNERAAEARLMTTAKALYRLLLEPVRPLLAGVTRLVVAPDSQLHLVPFGALATADNRYVVEDWELSFVGAGREILRSTSQVVGGGGVCVFVDPDYDMPPAHPVPVQKTTHHNRLSQYLTTVRWAALPGTREEAVAIRDALVGEEVRVYAGEMASESQLKSLVSPRILHIATHGFFLSDGDLAPLAASDERTFEMGLPAMLRSGLALAGANTLARRPVSGEVDKGLISAAEVSVLDLRGTDLVVLSGCETAVGSPLPGEGVVGLRSAFQQAGAQQLVSTLWRVPDQESAAMFRLFYLRLGKGLSPTQALREACLETLAQRRHEHGAAHPLFWGAFVAIGTPRELAGMRSTWPSREGERVALGLDGATAVDAVVHTLRAAKPVPCITMITRGLQDLGHPELALTLVRPPTQLPGPLLALFRRLVGQVRNGLKLTPGTLVSMPTSATGLLGGGRFHAALVWIPHKIEAVQGTTAALTLILLTLREAALVDQAGPVRLLGRLGLSTRFFPTAPWADPARDELVSNEDFAASLLSKVPTLHLSGARISRVNRGDLSGVSVELEVSAEARVREIITAHPDIGGLIILGGHDPESDAVMVWRGPSHAPEAIVPGPPRARRLTLNFVAILRGEADCIEWLEDGAVWRFGERSWARFVEVVAARRPFEVELSDRRARWSWLPEGVPTSAARLVELHLLTPESEMAEALTMGELLGIVKRAELAVLRAVRDIDGHGLDMIMELSLQTDEVMEMRRAFSAPASRELLDAIDAALADVAWPMLPGRDVCFQLRFGCGSHGTRSFGLI